MLVEDQEFQRFKEQILREGPRLDLEDSFKFKCHPGVACFNRCCHDVTIFLTSYDILRARARLGITTGDFLDRHCILPFSKGMRFPIVHLRMNEDEAKSCPFLDEENGCSIYEDRPWACRMYPLGRAAPPEGHAEETFFFLLEEDFCEGHGEEAEQTVGKWIEDQGIDEYEKMGLMFQEIVQHKEMLAGDELTPAQMNMLYMACYNLDTFRRFVFESTFLDKFDVDEARLERARIDDEALMQLGVDWLRFALWREPTIKIHEEAAEQAKKAMVEQAKQKAQDDSKKD